jgi:CRP-like cAMP-binding protein
LNHDRLLQVLTAAHPLTEAFEDALVQELVPLSLPAHYILLEAPRTASHLYFLNKGFAMGYRYREGRKEVEEFWVPGQFIVSVRSFFEQRGAEEFIQVITPSELWCIGYERFIELLHAFPEGNSLQRILMSECYEHYRERLRETVRLSGGDRYRKLVQEYPAIEQLVSQEQIASYLGITPQSLSRIKRQHKRDKR